MAFIYENLPGVRVIYRDGGLIISSTPNVTESVLFLGTATDGPTLKPIAFNNVEDAMVAFGDMVDSEGVPNGANLIRAAKEAFKAGCRDVRLVRISGTKGNVKVKTLDDLDFLLATATNEGSLYNEVELTITESTPGSGNGSIAVTKPTVKGAGFEVEVFADDTIATLTNRINSHRFNNVLSLGIDSDAPSTVTETSSVNLGQNGGLGIGSFVLATGSDEIGLPKEEIYRRLNQGTLELPVGTYTLLENYDADYAVPVDLYVDDVLLDDKTDTPTMFTSTDIKDAIRYRDVESSTAKYYFTLTLSGTWQDFPIKPIYRNVIDTITQPFPGMENNTSFDAEACVFAPIVTANVNWDTIDDATEVYTDITNGIAKDNEYEIDWAAGKIKGGTNAPADVVRIYYFIEANFADQLALYCHIVSSNQNETLGVIGKKPPVSTDLSVLRTAVLDLVDTDAAVQKGFFNSDPDGTLTDTGKYICVVTMPEIVYVDDKVGNYAASGAAAYAALSATMLPHESTTLHVIPGAFGLRYNLSASQLNDLTGAHYVGLTMKGGIPSFVDGITAASDLVQGVQRSDFWRWSTMRIVRSAAEAVRTAVLPFIGKGTTVPIANNTAMRASIKTNMDILAKKGAIRDYSFQVIADLSQQILGKATILLTVVPAFELRAVNVIVNAAPAIVR